MSHVDDSTSPQAAAASTLMRPTIAWSMKNITTLVSCARIDGMLSCTIRFSLSLRVICPPVRILSNRASLSFFENMGTKVRISERKAKKKQNFFAFIVGRSCFPSQKITFSKSENNVF